ncbi:MAG TPA: hypothetical protein VIS05_03745 [Ilumatobacter sp.]
MGSPDELPAGAAGELERLRALVGPSEVAYEALRADRDAAVEVARSALAEAGELRGQITEMSVQLSRARQDQDLLQRRAQMSVGRLVGDRVAHRWRTSVVPRAQRLRFWAR